MDFFLLFGVFIDAKLCPRICGRVKEKVRQDEINPWGEKYRSAMPVDKKWSNISSNEDDFDDSRIVNGWNVTDRYGNTGCGVFKGGVQN